jgi:hypothetical protein
MFGGRSSSLVRNCPLVEVTLIFFVSPSTPSALPTALCVLRSLYSRTVSPVCASTKY